MPDYDLGTDINVSPDLDEDEGEVSDLDCLAQDLLLRLDQPRGIDDGTEDGAEYGFDVRALLNESMTPQRLLECVVNIELEVLKDDRVDTCSAARSRFDQMTRTLYILLDIVTASGPHALSIVATPDNLTLIEAQ